MVQVQGRLVLNASNSSIFEGDAIKIALGAAVADVAGVDISAVVVTLTKPRRLQSDIDKFSIVTVEYTIAMPADEAAAVVERIVSTELSLATTLVARQLNDANFDGVVEVTGFSAEIVANDSGADEVKDGEVKDYRIALVFGAGIVAIFGLLCVLCCCCYRCCCHGNGAAQMQKTDSLPPILINMEEGFTPKF